MSIRFVIGRAGSGKSTWCLDQLRQRLKNQPAGEPLILLVPEQATFQAEYALVTTPGLTGTIRAQVLSFRRLAYRIMQETGGTMRTPIDDSGKKLLLYKLLQQHQQELRMFHHAAEQSGFVDGLNELYNELKRYCITTDSLEQYVHNNENRMEESNAMLADKLHDLLYIYQAYEKEMSSLYIDAEDYIDILAKQLKDSTYVRHAEIWIDGFHGFTPQEYQVIEQMMLHADKLNITLCLDREYGGTENPDELDLFHPTASTMIILQQLADQHAIHKEPSIVLQEDVFPRFEESPMLSHVEQFYHARKPMKQEKELTDISIHAAAHRRAEVEGAARELLRLTRDCDYRWRDITVMVRNIADYEDLISTIFSDYQIPYFMDQKQTVMHHPLVEFIRSSLETIQFHWKYDSIFRCVKTDLLVPFNSADSATDSLVDKHSMDQLENYVLEFGIQGSRWFDAKPWSYLRRRSLEADEHKTTDQDANFLESIEQTRQCIVRPLRSFQLQLESAGNVREQVSALFELLERIQATKQLEQWSTEAASEGKLELAREHIQIWGKVIDMLDQLVEVMGEEQVSLDMFSGLIETGLESMKLAQVPPSLDQVLIGSMERTRSSQIKYTFILGVNDGILPEKVKEGSVLTEQEREELSSAGLKLAPSSRRKLLDEQFLIYIALTAPSEHLWLSYPLADEEGKALLPSEVIRRIQSMFPQLDIRFLMAEPMPVQEQSTQMEYIAHAERVLSYLAVQLRQWRRGVEIDSIWWDVYNWYSTHAQWQRKLKRILTGLFHRNQEQVLMPTTSRLLYGDHLNASVSRMERFVSCPFAHFISHGLRLQERPIYRLEAPDIGQLFHAALTKIAQQLQKENIFWGDLTQEQCEQQAAQAVDQLTPRLQGEILLSSKRYYYIANKLKRIVGRASVVLGEHARRGSFTPVGLELDFGRKGTLPPLIFNLDNGFSMEIIGRIDRVDRADTEQGTYLRVIDYKSSQTALDLSNVYYGLSLQVLTYLDVVITHAEQWLGHPAKPAGVLYFHVFHPMLQKKNKISAEQAAEELFKQHKMKGLIMADNEAVQLMDHQLKQGYSDIIPVAVKTDGSYYRHASVVTEGQWERLRDYIRTSIRSIGEDITNGHVEIQPYRIGTRTPCTFCAYKSICQFDQLYEDNDYRYLRKLDKSIVLEEVEKDNSSFSKGGRSI